MLFSTAQLPELTGERPAFDDPAENGGYCLVSVRRDLIGVLTAEVYDYNEVGFTEGGVHTRTHYFTMVCEMCIRDSRGTEPAKDGTG